MNAEGQPDSESAKTTNGDTPVKAPEVVDGVNAPEPATEAKPDTLERAPTAFERSALKWTRATFGILGATCLFVCLQWCSMSSQLGEMQKDRELTANTFMRDSRPWVTTKLFHLTAEPGGVNKSVVQFRITNSGKTPAIDSLTLAVPYLMNGDPAMTNYPSDPESPTKQHGSRQILAPGADHWAETGQLPISEPFVSQYRAGVLRVFVTSKIYYSDTFGTRHWTTMCAYHMSGTSLDDFTFCETGNDVDREPK